MLHNRKGYPQKSILLQCAGVETKKSAPKAWAFAVDRSAVGGGVSCRLLAVGRLVAVGFCCGLLLSLSLW